MKLPVSQEGAKLVASPRHSIILRNNQVKPVLEGVSDHEAYAVEVDPSNKSIQNNEKEAKRCLLTDPNETSHSFSVQMMVENSMNPDLESTFTFVDEVVKSVGPYSRSKFPNHILVHFCRNVWESGQAYDAHKLANEVYEVILAPDTHLYFDHPYEPDPEERGLYWACRYLDTHKVFRFVPENLMFNADVKLTGEKITKLDLQLLREFEDFTELKKPKNITGIQGQIWTESVIFPLLIALAERAWHKAPWEDVDPKKRKPKEDEDWSVFAHMLGNKELKCLEAANIFYHIPPPGARVAEDGLLELSSCYPDQPMSYSVDKGQTWKPYLQMADVVSYDEVLARVSSHNGCHHSRVISIPIQVYPDSDDQNN